MQLQKEREAFVSRRYDFYFLRELFCNFTLLFSFIYFLVAVENFIFFAAFAYQVPKREYSKFYTFPFHSFSSFRLFSNHRGYRFLVRQKSRVAAGQSSFVANPKRFLRQKTFFAAGDSNWGPFRGSREFYTLKQDSSYVFFFSVGDMFLLHKFVGLRNTFSWSYSRYALHDMNISKHEARTCTAIIFVGKGEITRVEF